MTYSSFRHDKFKLWEHCAFITTLSIIIITEVGCFLRSLVFEVIKGQLVNELMWSCCSVMFQVIVEMFCMTGMEMCVFFTVLLFCLMAALTRMLIDSVYRSVERKEVTVKMKKIRGSYLRLRMKVLCKW